MKCLYDNDNVDDVISPALIYYKKIIIDNIKLSIKIAGSADRLWPHVKTHKSESMVKLQQSLGINKFKCATIAEAEMLAMAHAEKIVLAYPLVGPNIKRFLQLIKTYPDSTFYAIGDDYDTIKKLGEAAAENGMTVSVMIDVNMGMDRTGAPIDEVEALYARCAELPGIEMTGLHCYDGNRHESDVNERMVRVAEVDKKIEAVVSSLEAKKIKCPILIMGGTPSFPCHAKLTKYYLSPGTVFINDAGYRDGFKDLPFVPAAALLTRVISHPVKGVFTLDLGYKAIASDPQGVRGELQNWPNAEPVLQNEEHWVFKMKKGHENEVPPIGTVLYVIPTHICPTSALYPSVLVSENGKITESWDVTARNRKINI
ncbi:D-TA family PLP-dependent enzyme [Treponema parvum]|uniref:D-TA family PLP-dependent enzyme n=1 Tax=Treponema parvum TaxID=138851 RepID=A0A975EYI2_9SPIR|nr:D-TA family PLP-dependent enzyme [Treponema parvum]QTQ11276.1 D-TA family PLP-dependent enzyme [Treponema parvum]